MLAKAGKKVLVLEQHDQAGGCCHTFIEKGFEFDVGKSSSMVMLVKQMDSIYQNFLSEMSMRKKFLQILPIANYACAQAEVNEYYCCKNTFIYLLRITGHLSYGILSREVYLTFSASKKCLNILFSKNSLLIS